MRFQSGRITPAKLKLAGIGLGSCSMLIQLILLREMLVVCLGNELSLGTILGSWLILVGAGSWIASQMLSNPRLILGLGYLAIFPISLGQLALIRSIKQILGLAPGELMGLSQIWLCSLTILAPGCLILGSIFPAISRCLEEFTDRSRAPGIAYFWESLGLILGSGAFSILIWLGFNPVLLICLLGLTCFGIAGWILEIKLLALMLIPGMLMIQSGSLDGFLRQLHWAPYRLIQARDTIYGNIAVVAQDSQLSIFYNGALESFPLDPSQEELGHIPALLHPNPAKILGIGATQLIPHLIQHPMAQLTILELDPELLNLSLNYLEIQPDPRLRFELMDGRRYLKLTQQKYDLIILDLPNPSTAQLNRFYTAEFLDEVKQVLEPGGILALKLSSSPGYWGLELRELISSIHATLSSRFEQVVLIPGMNILLIGSDRELNLSSMIPALQSRNLSTELISVDYLEYLISQPRLRAWLELLVPSQINTDLKPSSYYHQLLIWMGMLDPELKSLLVDLQDWLGWIMLGAGLVALFICWWIKLPGSRAALGVIGIAGATGMGMELGLLLIFQCIHGYVYWMMGILIGCFMAGLMLGSWISNRYLDIKLIHIQLIAIACPVSLVIAGLIPDWIYPGLMLMMGMITGADFPAAARLGASAGSLYASDLLGSFLGAITISSILVPLYGLAQLGYGLCALNAIGALMLIQARSS